MSERVEIRVPADVGYVSTLRLTAASLAARCELTIDEIEDLRLAVDEACSLLLPHARPGSMLDVRFEVAAGRLAVEASVPTTAGAERCVAPFPARCRAASWIVLPNAARTAQ